MISLPIARRSIRLTPHDYCALINFWIRSCARLGVLFMPVSAARVSVGILIGAGKPPD